VGGATAFSPSPDLAASRRHAQAGRRWLARLPDLTRDAARLWSLEVERRIDGGHFAHVVACRTGDGRQVVLRLTPDDATREVAMLRAWARIGAAPTVLEHDAKLGATLMVKVNSRLGLAETFERYGEGPLCTLLRHLHATTVPRLVQLPHARHAITYGFSRAQRRVSAGTAGDVASTDVTRATTLAARLLDASPRRAALHGDLSPGNLLESNGRLLAIDPAPCLGPPEIDGAFAALTGPWGTTTLSDRLDRLAAGTNLDRRALDGWARALALERACALWHDDVDLGQATQLLSFARNG